MEKNLKEKIINIHYFSIVTVPITVLVAGNKCMTATGFLYSKDDKYVYLVTNWHVVTGGRNPNYPNNSSTGSIPTHIACVLHVNINREDNFDFNKTVKMTIPINDEHGNKPIWFEHPTYNQKVDVVVIKIDKAEIESRAKFNTLKEYDKFQEAYVPAVMDDAFIVGYPWGLTGGNPVLPLYKKGSIASEPLFDFNALPCFLIDSRATQGMSGSFVLASKWGVYKETMGTFTQFLGVYSARRFSQENTGEISDIGLVWRAPVIDEIINGNFSGRPLKDIL